MFFSLWSCWPITFLNTVLKGGGSYRDVKSFASAEVLAIKAEGELEVQVSAPGWVWVFLQSLERLEWGPRKSRRGRRESGLREESAVWVVLVVARFRPAAWP